VLRLGAFLFFRYFWGKRELEHSKESPNILMLTQQKLHVNESLDGENNFCGLHYFSKGILGSIPSCQMK